MANEGTTAPRLHPCPSCGLTDRVSGVPAVYVAGRNKVNVVVPRTDDRMEHTESRLVTTALADALAPVPTAPPGLWTGCLGVPLLAVAVGTFIGGATSGHWFGGYPVPPPGAGLPFEAHPDYAYLGVISLLALVARCEPDPPGRVPLDRLPAPVGGRPSGRRAAVVPGLVLRALRHCVLRAATRRSSRSTHLRGLQSGGLDSGGIRASGPPEPPPMRILPMADRRPFPLCCVEVGG
jgi:hypothetical protein